jgi:hypothetical protein
MIRRFFAKKDCLCNLYDCLTRYLSYYFLTMPKIERSITEIKAQEKRASKIGMIAYQRALIFWNRIARNRIKTRV